MTKLANVDNKMLEEAISKINNLSGEKKFDIGLIPGSDISSLVESPEEKIEIPYEEIPGFPTKTLGDRKKNLVISELEGKSVVSLTGRFYYFNGCSMQEIAFPIYVMAGLGVHTLMLTCSAGGINKDYKVGDVMIIRDHINFLGDNPLFGTSDFMNMSNLYDHSLSNFAQEILKRNGFNVQNGVYVAWVGPTYETPAEYKMLEKLGADAVGMSVVPEATAAKKAGLRMLAYARITDLAVPEDYEKLSHNLILERQEQTKLKFIKATKEIIGGIND